MTDYVFMGCNSRLGIYRTLGPVTGDFYAIPMLGTWVKEEDAEALKEVQIQTFCFRTNGLITIYPVFELNPSMDQLKLKPSV